MLHLPATAVTGIVAHALRCLPEECCGLLVGTFAAGPDGTVAGDQARAERFVPTTNVARSARVYTIDPREHLRADREAAAAGLDVIGVVHSHTHTEPYPSPTDVAQAPDPAWHYVIVSLKRGEPELRSYRIVDGVISEEPITVVEG